MARHSDSTNLREKLRAIIVPKPLCHKESDNLRGFFDKARNRSWRGLFANKYIYMTNILLYVTRARGGFACWRFSDLSDSLWHKAFGAEMNIRPRRFYPCKLYAYPVV